MSAITHLGRDAIYPKVRANQAELLEPVFSGWKKAVNWMGILVWLVCLLYLGEWWFDAHHIVSYPRFTAVTIALAWITLVPAYFIFIFAFAKVPSESVTVPTNFRVATVVTKAPSEPLAVVQKTLLGALNQEGVAHDAWLADEMPTLETLRWCRENGIRVSTRQGVADYQRPNWPRRARCKEGNLAYFYDHYGYESYDIVSQFDADHVPSPGYLKHVLTPFIDPRVGYVSAPSICDSNASESWVARGRLYLEASLHGALQAGYNSGWAPLCIGSHYTVRTVALKEVGGLGPELAEDHSTTLLFHASGWRGVHAINAIAHGAGPETFTDLVMQEFQWSRSLMTILLQYSPTKVSKLKGRIRFQFLFSQFWYPLFSTMMAAMFVMPVYALVSGMPMANATYLDFVVHMLPVSTVLLVLAYWWRSTGTFRPADAKILSWEGVAFLFLRWPWSLIGWIAAIIDRLRGRVADFRVTPKGRSSTEPLPFRVIAPYLFLSLVAAATAWLVREPGSAAGFYMFNIINAVLYGGLAVLILTKHSLENGLGFVPRTAHGVVTAALLVAAGGAVGLAIHDNGLKGLAAWNEGITAFSLTRRIYSYSGASRSMQGEPELRFDPRWNPSN
ncbi:MAG: glycosyltransferase [Hydrogenophaga sp.]|nr:glycosyltransferase [Hydrogenophaga sp.]